MDIFDIFFYEQNITGGKCRFNEGDNSVSMFESDEGYHVQKEPPFPDMVCKSQSFYVDTLTLKTEGYYLKLGGTKIGIWKNYNKHGEVIEEKDYEEGYDIHWEELQGVLDRDKINLKSIMSIKRYDYEKPNTIDKQRVIKLENQDNNINENNEGDFELGNIEIVDSEDKQESQKKELIKCWALSLIQAGMLKVHVVYDGVTGELIDADAKPLL